MEFYQYSIMLLKNNIVFRRVNSALKKIVLEKSKVATYEGSI